MFKKKTDGNFLPSSSLLRVDSRNSFSNTTHYQVCKSDLLLQLLTKQSSEPDANIKDLSSPSPWCMSADTWMSKGWTGNPLYSRWATDSPILDYLNDISVPSCAGVRHPHKDHRLMQLLPFLTFKTNLPRDRFPPKVQASTSSSGSGIDLFVFIPHSLRRHFFSVSFFTFHYVRGLVHLLEILLTLP